MSYSFVILFLYSKTVKKKKDQDTWRSMEQNNSNMESKYISFHCFGLNVCRKSKKCDRISLIFLSSWFYFRIKTFRAVYSPFFCYQSQYLPCEMNSHVWLSRSLSWHVVVIVSVRTQPKGPLLVSQRFLHTWDFPEWFKGRKKGCSRAEWREMRFEGSYSSILSMRSKKWWCSLPWDNKYC